MGSSTNVTNYAHEIQELTIPTVHLKNVMKLHEEFVCVKNSEDEMCASNE